MADIQHRVQKGDCIASIADKYGHFWGKVWQYGPNAQLKNLRKNPNVLMDGDVVVVPEKAPGEKDAATDQLHTYRRKGVPSKVRLRMMAHDKPRRDIDWTFDVDGKTHRGKTDGDGYLSLPVPPGVQRGVLKLYVDNLVEEHTINLGYLNPITEVTGIQQRLRNLGIECPESGAMDEDTKNALNEFRAKYELEPADGPDQATIDKLKEVHGA
ncbi:MAG TPA: hypothetical protein DEH78_00060 [Solibacterales bacterium]|nr:hypothetical protein [Bryobacterales bacterium]